MGSRQFLDLSRYIPAQLSIISNKLSHGASEKYRRLFGVGITEWRVLATVAVEPGISANRLCQLIGIDKALASRVLSRLAGRHLVAVQSDPNNARRSLLRLTGSGQQLHDRVLLVVRERERILHSAFSHAEIETLLSLLHRLHAQADIVNEYEPGQVPSRDVGARSKSPRRSTAKSTGAGRKKSRAVQRLHTLVSDA